MLEDTRRVACGELLVEGVEATVEAGTRVEEACEVGRDGGIEFAESEGDSGKCGGDGDRNGAN